jgi:hypothetical protein
MMAFGKKQEADYVQQGAIKAAEDGLTIIVVRFNEKLTASQASGTVETAASAGISAVESTGLWRFNSMTVEKDTRTLGDRMAFFATFIRTEGA